MYMPHAVLCCVQSFPNIQLQQQPRTASVSLGMVLGVVKGHAMYVVLVLTQKAAPWKTAKLAPLVTRVHQALHLAMTANLWPKLVPLARLRHQMLSHRSSVAVCLGLEVCVVSGDS